MNPKQQKSYYKHCSSKTFYLKETLCHRRLAVAWRACMEVEAMSREALTRAQQEKLAKMLAYCVKHVPFYRDWASQNGMHKKALRLDEFPIIDKGTIRGQEERFVSDEFQLNKLSSCRTSGSTGQPFLFYKSKNSFDHTYATLWRGLARYGIRPGDKRVLIKGLDVTQKLGLRQKLNRKLYNALNRCLLFDAHFLAINPQSLGTVIRKIVAYKPDYYHGYVSSIYQVARYVEENKVDVSGLRLKAIVTESEKLHDFQRECLDRVFGVPVVENYGSVEFGMIAQPDTAGNLCVNEDHVVVETTVEGEAVITNLDEYGFPFIRFKNGDLLELGGPGKILPYQIITSLKGRVAETIYLPSGGSLQGFVVMYPISKHMKWIKSYQVYQPKLNHLILRFVLDGDLPERIKKQIVDEMREIVGEEMQLSLECVDRISLTRRGKQRFVISELHRG
ncbi:MAG: phenylacetate--CoA ligase family protein, partial [Fastidiosipilaceae bacterium]